MLQCANWVWHCCLYCSLFIVHCHCNYTMLWQYYRWSGSQMYCSVFKVTLLGEFGSIPAGCQCWNPLLPHSHLHGSEPVSALTLSLYIAVLPIIFFFLDFVSGNLSLTGFQLHEHPNSTILEHLEFGQGPGLSYICRLGTWKEGSTMRVFKF